MTTGLTQPMGNNRAKTKVLADAMSPGELWRYVQELKDEDFPVAITYNKDTVHLHDTVEARLFGLGVHFGSMAHAGMHDIADF